MQKLIITYTNGNILKKDVNYATIRPSVDNDEVAVIQYSPIRHVYGFTSPYEIIEIDPEYIDSVEVKING